MHNDTIKLVISIIFFSMVIIMITVCTRVSSDNGGSKLGRIGNAMVFPGSDWETKTPESQGVDPSALTSALDYLNAHAGGAGTFETVVVRNGYVIWKGSNVGNSHIIYSATKTFTTTVLGVLIREGRISLDDYAVKYMPQLDDTYSRYGKITIRQLASMTSGYSGIGYKGSTGGCWELYEGGRMAEYDRCVSLYTTPGTPDFQPGVSLAYNDAAVHVLGYILTQIAGESLEDVFRKNIAIPIGITQFDWTDYGMKEFGSQRSILFNNPAGTPAGNLNGRETQGGVSITAEDIARYGLLYLNRGNWHGQQIIDSSFVNQALVNQVPALFGKGKDDAIPGRFGFMWWTNGTRWNGRRPMPDAPAGTAAARGASVNFCFVIPEWNMVISRLSPPAQSGMPGFDDTVWNTFFKILKKGISLT